MATVIVLVVLAAVLFFLGRSLFRQKKSGGCSGCPGCGSGSCGSGKHSC